MSAKFGHITTQATKDKIRKSLMGHPVSDETRKKLSKVLTGTKWSKEERANHKDCHSGQKHWHWKGGRRYDKSNGYVYLYHPRKSRGILEHRVVAENHLRRKLTKKEIVHHINMVENDNRPENLYVFKNKNSHAWYHRKFNIDKKSVPILKSNII